MQDAHSGQDVVQFGKLPYRVVTSGVLGQLKRSELVVYVIIAAHSNGDDFTSRPSIPTIAHEAVLNDRTTQRAVRSLAGRGLITVHLGGGQTTNTYELATDPRQSYATPGTATDPRQSYATPPPAKKALTPGRAVPPKQKNREITEPAAAAAAGGGDREKSNGGRDEKSQNGNGPEKTGNDTSTKATDPVVAERCGALAAAGIGNPKRRELAKDVHLTPETIRVTAAWCRDHGKGVGVLVLELEALSGAASAKALSTEDLNIRWDAIAVRNEAEERQGRARKALVARLSDDGRTLLHYMSFPLPAKFPTRWDQLKTKLSFQDWTFERYERACLHLDQARFPEAWPAVIAGGVST